jgi:hypothetical protein
VICEEEEEAVVETAAMTDDRLTDAIAVHQDAGK